jgi:hypothetical protein
MNVTPAYLFRKVADEQGKPVILFDEIDTIFGPKAKDNEDIRGMLNAGHRKGAVAGRCVVRGKTVETEELDAYCAVALAGLDDLPATLMSRSVIVRMRPRLPGEAVEPFRLREQEPTGHKLRDRLTRWIMQAIKPGDVTWPVMPEEIQDRDADVWEALFMVADAAGGEWPVRARKAGVQLVLASKERSPSFGVRLLTDLQTVFRDDKSLSTEEILTRLWNLEMSPWQSIKGEPLDARGLAFQLGRYDVKPVNIWFGKKCVKGYKRTDLHDTWARYLAEPSAEPSGLADHADDGEPDLANREGQLVPSSTVEEGDTGQPEAARVALATGARSARSAGNVVRMARDYWEQEAASA